MNKNKKLKLAISIAAALGFSASFSAKATELAMANPSVHEQGSSVDPETINARYTGRITRDPKLVYQLAQLYETGRGVARNNEIAFRLYQYAAINGVAEAQYSLGLMYSDERCPVNIADAQQEAMFWLEQAARQGHPQARFSYNYLLENTHYAGC